MCESSDCLSKTNFKKTKLKFIKYDEVNLKYMYLCCVPVVKNGPMKLTNLELLIFDTIGFDLIN